MNNYRAYVMMKTKSIKIQHSSLHTLVKEWFGNSL